QSSDQAAQNRLRILEDNAECRGRALEPIVGLPGRLVLRQKNEKNSADHKTGDAHSYPEASPGEASSYERTYYKLAGRSAGHAEHLCRADQSRSDRGRKVLSGDVDRTYQRKDAACTLN